MYTAVGPVASSHGWWGRFRRVAVALLGGASRVRHARRGRDEGVSRERWLSAKRSVECVTMNASSVRDATRSFRNPPCRAIYRGERVRAENPTGGRQLDTDTSLPLGGRALGRVASIFSLRMFLQQYILQTCRRSLLPTIKPLYDRSKPAFA